MGAESNGIYGLCRTNVLLDFNKFHFLYVMRVIKVSEKGQ